jgi:hypothetical protein
MFFSCLPCVPHSLPIPLRVFLIRSPKWHSVSSTQHDGPCYVSLTLLLSRHPSYAVLDAVKKTNIGTLSSRRQPGHCTTWAASVPLALLYSVWKL